MKYSLITYKQHRHHHQCRMMVPRTPLPDLIVRHTTYASCVFKGTFDSISLPLHPTQPFQRRVSRLIVEGNSCDGFAPESPRHGQIPAINLIRLPVPHVNFQPADPNSQYSTLCFANRQCFPILCRERIHKSQGPSPNPGHGGLEGSMNFPFVRRMCSLG